MPITISPGLFVYTHHIEHSSKGDVVVGFSDTTTVFAGAVGEAILAQALADRNITE
jgi:hypothetical protein